MNRFYSSKITSLGLARNADAANYIAFDESAPTTEVLKKGWEDDLLGKFVSERNQESSDKDSDCEEVVETNITSISEALAATENLKLFSVSRGYNECFSECVSFESKL